MYESLAASRQNVTLGRASTSPTADQALWVAIRAQAQALSFSNYETFIDGLLCADDTFRPAGVSNGQADADQMLARRRRNPGLGNVYMSNVDAYALLKIATDAFLLLNCDVALPRDYDENEEASRLNDTVPLETIKQQLTSLLGDNKLPYIQRILDTNLSGIGSVKPPYCYGVLESRTEPCMLELIWSYWHEEGMLAQTLSAISMRFQNRHGPGTRDPLANLAIDPLRTLNNLLWGYIQDEQHRLSVVRRAYEYDHQYGLKLVGKAVPPIHSAESRAKFLEAFHNLIYRAHRFYQEDDDTTVIANGFPVLNGLKEVHMLLAEGAHNQVFDLTWSARAEMMVMQWLLSRQEIRSYLGTRVMIPYREGWMAQADSMKRLQGWTDTSVTHFRDLGVFGEQALLSIRYGDWINVDSQESAKNWARYWRQEIQAYTHAYQAVTGVDLAADTISVKQAESRSVIPAYHIQRRMSRQQKK
ncbi:MAG: hypothetical protein ACR2GR_03970, partial [Rhodothermales bacterium]